MATKNFTQFNTAAPLLTSDYIVGYNPVLSAEIKTQVQDIINLVGESDSQTLSFNETNKELTISSGNTISLSSLSDTAFANVSSSFATNNFVQASFFPLSGGTISGPTRINNNLTVFGNLSATGTTTFANTVFSTTSSLSVVHVGAGPALWVGNTGTGDIASFYDIDQNLEVLHVGGENGTFPNVGVKTSVPNKTLTVAGEISATQDITNTGKIFTTGGNSDQWNAARAVATTYQTVSSSFATNTTVNTVSSQLTLLTTTNTLTSQLVTNIQIFTSSGTWTKPAGAVRVQVILIGGGGAGGSGRSGSNTVIRTGGGGGAGGAYQTTILDAAILSATVLVTIGTGGIGPAGFVNVNGNAGGNGGSTSFGNYSIANGGTGGPGGTASAQSGAAGGTISGSGFGVAGGTGGATTTTDGGNGGDTAVSAPGGGAGGSLTAANARRRGGDGGINTSNGLARALGGLTTDALPGSGAAGASVAALTRIPGQGGGGGCAQTSGQGGSGGNGGAYGAGGGGGGGGADGLPAGGGGNGADGLAVIITYFI